MACVRVVSAPVSRSLEAGTAYTGTLSSFRCRTHSAVVMGAPSGLRRPKGYGAPLIILTNRVMGMYLGSHTYKDTHGSNARGIQLMLPCGAGDLGGTHILARTHSGTERFR